MIHPELDLNFASDANLKQARQWLSDCEQKHPKCPIVNQNATLPTRLIDVQSTRLVPGSYARTQGYASLSYCWGVGKRITTTSSNVALFYEKMEFTQLPQTIQDAATVADNLGLRYLWVDSLCT
jgi:hypothetical protein